ncbi:hypothetical protein [Streptomyces nojiriensis]|uniref:hypothetical protein n=1 Tax=Streptomyces nojiriensis TaxID=66374 RepID=UPI00364F852D
MAMQSAVRFRFLSCLSPSHPDIREEDHVFLRMDGEEVWDNFMVAGKTRQIEIAKPLTTAHIQLGAIGPGGAFEHFDHLREQLLLDGGFDTVREPTLTVNAFETLPSTGHFQGNGAKYELDYDFIRIPD